MNRFWLPERKKTYYLIRDTGYCQAIPAGKSALPLIRYGSGVEIACIRIVAAAGDSAEFPADQHPQSQQRQRHRFRDDRELNVVSGRTTNVRMVDQLDSKERMRHPRPRSRSSSGNYRHDS